MESKLIVKFNGRNAVLQCFSLPKPTVKYLLLSGSPQMIKKLYKTCKLFYLKLQLTIVDHLYINNDTYVPRIWQNNIELHVKDIEWLFNRLWLCGLRIHGNVPFDQIASKVDVLDIKDLFITGGEITLDKLKTINQSGKVEKFWSNARVCNSDGTAASLESILECLPNAIEFFLNYDGNCHLTTKTLKKLLLIEKPRKFKVFALREINQDVSPLEMLNEFLKKNVDPNGDIVLQFPDFAYNNTFSASFLPMLRQWKPNQKSF